MTKPRTNRTRLRVVRQTDEHETGPKGIETSCEGLSRGLAA